MIRIQVCLFLKTGRHKTFSEMAEIRQFIRSELSIIKKEVIESTRSMIRNEIRSISFDSNLWILFLVLIYGPSPSPRYNLLVTIYQWFTFCTMSNCSLSSTFFILYLYSVRLQVYNGTQGSNFWSRKLFESGPKVHLRKIWKVDQNCNLARDLEFRWKVKPFYVQIYHHVPNSSFGPYSK